MDQFEQDIFDFVSSQDSSEKNEWYATQRDFALDIMQDFVFFINSRRKYPVCVDFSLLGQSDEEKAELLLAEHERNESKRLRELIIGDYAARYSMFKKNGLTKATYQTFVDLANKLNISSAEAEKIIKERAEK